MAELPRSRAAASPCAAPPARPRGDPGWRERHTRATVLPLPLRRRGVGGVGVRLPAAQGGAPAGRRQEGGRRAASPCRARTRRLACSTGKGPGGALPASLRARGGTTARGGACRRRIGGTFAFRCLFGRAALGLRVRRSGRTHPGIRRPLAALLPSARGAVPLRACSGRPGSPRRPRMGGTSRLPRDIMTSGNTGWQSPRARPRRHEHERLLAGHCRGAPRAPPAAHLAASPPLAGCNRPWIACAPGSPSRLPRPRRPQPPPIPPRNPAAPPSRVRFRPTKTGLGPIWCTSFAGFP